MTDFDDIVAEILSSGTLPEGATAQATLSEILCHLLTHVTKGQARETIQTLPAVFQEHILICMRHEQEEELEEICNRFDFINCVAARFGIAPEHAEKLTRAVLEAVISKIPEDEAGDVARQLPEDLCDLWPSSKAV